MKGTVLISTHHLKTAGALRAEFRGEGYGVELVTSNEDISTMENPALLLLTGEPQAAERLASQAGELRIPTYAIFSRQDREWRKSVREFALEEAFFHPVDPEEVLLLGRTLIERRHLQEVTGIVGETDAMREALERVVQIAPVASTVLVTGESGTGKELVARGIHALSPRRHKPFIAVNVAALSETLLESELFGHEKGAFTGAIDSRRGFFELAHRGTIFLDEIGEMPLATQTKLLRVLEQREFLRVGGERPIKVDVRIVAATNQPIRQLVAREEFRKDLYYRLNVLHIELPPLRGRREDIPLLVEAFVREIGERNDRHFAGISEEAMEILMAYRWPGNVRELRNLIESMVVLSPGRMIGPEDIPSEVRAPERMGTMLPVPIPPHPLPAREGEDRSFRPELEFIFRTLMELRVDMDDLRRQFEAYKGDVRHARDLRTATPLLRDDGYEIEVVPSEGEGEAPPMGVATAAGGEEGAEGTRGDQEGGIVVYRPGMTMEEIEREAIAAALAQSGGNRKKAADLLGIGERTLYRKIRRFKLMP